MSGDSFGCHNLGERVLRAWGRWRPGTLLSTCRAQDGPPQRTIWPQCPQCQGGDARGLRTSLHGSENVTGSVRAMSGICRWGSHAAPSLDYTVTGLGATECSAVGVVTNIWVLRKTALLGIGKVFFLIS